MSATQGGIDRRALLRSAVLATGGAALVGATAAGPAAAQHAVSSTLDTFDQTTGPKFFDDATLNFQTLFAYAGAGYGTSEFGEVSAVVAAVQRRDSGYEAFAEEFLAMAARVGDRARDAQKAGHRVTAASTHLRASNYVNQALFFALAFPGADREPGLYRQMEAHFAAAMELSPYPAKRVQIPYEHTPLPAWFLTPPGPAKRRPTVLFINGSDGQNVDVYGWGALAALQRGYNALILEGPGQGAALFLRNIKFRPDWEKVTTPVVDWLRQQRGVDRKRIAIWGWSFGGYLVERALAFEHRLVAGVCDPGVTEFLASWPPAVIATAYQGDKAQVDAGWDNFLANSDPKLVTLLRKRLEIFPNPSSWYDAVREMAKYVMTPELLGRITTPMLITQAELEQFWPGQSQTVFDELRSRKELTRFSSADGSQYHCEPMAPQHRNEVILDWLAASDRLGG